MDWNWFFSSLAQSGAALVGIIGAFVISKLLNENEKYHGIILRIRELSMTRRRLKYEIDQCRFEWHNESTILSSDKFWDDLNSEVHADIEDINDRAKAYLWSVDGLYEHPRNIEIVKRILSRNEDEYSEYAFMFSPRDDTSSMRHLYEERNRIENVKNKCVDTISLHHHLLKDIKANQDNQKQLKVIVYILIVGVFLMVCYPLSFLPLEPDWYPKLIISCPNTLRHITSIQSWMLFWVLAIIVSVFSVFIASISKMSKTYNDFMDTFTEKRLNLWGYSEYFEPKPTSVKKKNGTLKK